MKMIYYNCYVIVLLLLIINVSSLTVMKGETISNETSEINDLLNEIERSIVKKERMKKKMKSSLKKIREKIEEIKNKKEIVERKEKEKELKSTENEIDNYSHQNKQNQIKLLQKLLRKVNSLQQEEYNEYKQAYIKEIENEKKNANHIAHSILNRIK